jgi:hypothetical protein
MRKSTSLRGSHVPFVEAAHHGRKQRPTAILLRTSWTTGDSGAAYGIAQAWHNPNNKVESCHYVVDTARVIRCVPDKVEALPLSESYKGAISINVCYDPPFQEDILVVLRTAELTARLCKLYHIPIRILDDVDEERWKNRRWRSRGGILLKTIGGFPTKDFLTFVGEEYKDF